MNAATIIGLVFSGVMLICSVITLVVSNARAAKKNTIEDAQKLATLSEGILKANIKLETICSTTTATQADVKQMSDIIQRHGERLVSLEKDVEVLKKNIEEA